MTIPAGWYPDPEREGALRWWSGEAWAPSQDDAGEAGADASSSWAPSTDDTSSWAPSQSDAPSWSTDATVPVPRPSWASDAPAQATVGNPSTASEPEWQDPQAWQGQSEQEWLREQQWTGSQEWQQAPLGPDAPPRRGSSLGIILSVAGGGLLLLIIAIIVIVSVVRGLPQGSQEADGDSGSAPIATFPTTVALDVPSNGEASQVLEVSEAAVYEIRAVSTNGEDPVLTLEMPDGEMLRDDDGGDGYDSLLSEALEPGTYTLGVTEYSGDALTVDLVVTQVATLEPPEPIQEVPAQVDVLVPQDLPVDQELVIDEAGVYEIGLTSTNGEDPYLTLMYPDGSTVTDDDGGDGLDSRITVMLEPGTYTLTLAELGGDELRGSLTVDLIGTVDDLDPIDSVPASVDLTLAQDMTQTVDLVIDEAGTYVLSVESTNSEDPRIELTSESGESWSDDDGGDGLDSLLEVELEPGTYTIAVEEYSGDPLTAVLEVTEG